MTTPPLFFALDVPGSAQALALAKKVKPFGRGVKIGMELFYAEGPDIVRRVREEAQTDIFLDLKLHDISRTICGAVQSLMPLEPYMLTLHASNGEAALTRAAACAAEEAEKRRLRKPLLLGVTVLTSLSDRDAAALGYGDGTSDRVLRLAEICVNAGLDGIVCSPLEAAAIKARFPDITAVTPGIRPAGFVVQDDDQARAATPKEALAQGADYLVIGRPVAHAGNPAAAAKNIAAECRLFLAE